MSETTRATLAAELTAVNASILKAIAAESYAAGDLSAQRNVETLRRHRTVLERQIAELDRVAAGADNGSVAIATFDHL